MQEARLAVAAVQLVVAAAEITSAGLLAQALPLALVGLPGLGGAGIERRVAQGEVELLVGADDASENARGVRLPAQLDPGLQGRIGREDLLAVALGVGINVAADELPAIFGVTDQGLSLIHI